MHIKCWGSRGSIPVSGKDYIKYGGDTTCLEVRTADNNIIIVDAGTGIRRLGGHLIEEGCSRYHIIFTHAHWDHLMGFPFFKPIYSKDSEIRLHRCPFPSDYVEKMIATIMDPPYFPVKFSDIKANILYEKACPTNFEIGSVTIKPIPLSHPNGGSGYKFIENGKSFVFLTDNELGFVHPGGLAYDDYVEFSSGTDLLIHDAEYTPQEYKTMVEYGHTAYTDALDLAMDAGVKKLGLFHLNQDRTDREMDAIENICRQGIAEAGHNLECFAVGTDMAFAL
jgi:phosphoribosyl 1,2-cyclic phosphodiesterase